MHTVFEVVVWVIAVVLLVAIVFKVRNDKKDD
jgi:hypothetical protein